MVRTLNVGCEHVAKGSKYTLITKRNGGPTKQSLRISTSKAIMALLK